MVWSGTGLYVTGSGLDGRGGRQSCVLRSRCGRGSVRPSARLRRTRRQNASPRLRPRLVRLVSTRGVVTEVVAAHPGLNVPINNAGILQAEDMLVEPCDLTPAEATVAINFRGPIRLTAALLPQLQAQKKAAVLNVSCGLAFVPLAATPTCSATRAALHSWSRSLRYPLRKTGVEVIEVAPPAVVTDRMPQSRSNPNALVLEDYIAEVMNLLTAGGRRFWSRPCCGCVRPRRTAAMRGCRHAQSKADRAA